MGDLLLPPRVRQEIQQHKWAEQRAQQRAMLDRLLDFDDPVCREWQPLLARLDPHLRLGRAHPQAYEPGMGVRPGLYHWVRENPTAMPTVTPITGVDGESFIEPDSRLLRELESNDLQNPLVDRALIERRAAVEHERERAEPEQDRRMDEEVLEHYLATNRAFVSMDRDNPWSQNVAGKRGVSK